jgi:hypothetical protein
MSQERRLHDYYGAAEESPASSLATGSFQPRRIAVRRIKKHTDAPAMVVGTGDQWSKCPTTTTAAPARAATA